MADVHAGYLLRNLIVTTLTNDFDTKATTISAYQGVTVPSLQAVLHSRKKWLDFPVARVTPVMHSLVEVGSGHTRSTLDVGVLIEDRDADPDALDDRCQVWMAVLMSLFDKVHATDGSYNLRVTEGDPSPAELSDGLWIQGVAVRITAHYATDRT